MSFIQRILTLALALALGSSSTFAATAIVEYGFHNQIYGTTLTIYSDGAVKIAERTCCPPHSDLTDIKLNAGALADLKTAIEHARESKVITKSGYTTADGSLSGSLFVRDAAGRETIIQEVARNEVVGLPDVVRINSSKSAADIKKLVDDLVRVKMPDLFLLKAAHRQVRGR